MAGSLAHLNSAALQGKKPTLSSREIKASQKHSNFDVIFFIYLFFFHPARSNIHRQAIYWLGQVSEDEWLC